MPRCIAGRELNNRPVHLVHPYGIDKLLSIEFGIISQIIKNYQDLEIHLHFNQNVQMHPAFTQVDLNSSENNSKNDTRRRT